MITASRFQGCYDQNASGARKMQFEREGESGYGGRIGDDDETTSSGDGWAGFDDFEFCEAERWAGYSSTAVDAAAGRTADAGDAGARQFG